MFIIFSPTQFKSLFKGKVYGPAKNFFEFWNHSHYKQEAYHVANYHPHSVLQAVEILQYRGSELILYHDSYVY